MKPSNHSGTPGHLPASLRPALAALVAAHPGRSLTWIARRFLAETGRPVSRMTVWRVRELGYSERPASGWIRGELRECLDLLVLEAGPDGSRSEVARSFAELAGRPVSVRTACRAFVRVHGRGVGKGHRVDGDLAGPSPAHEDRLDAERAAKLARAAAASGPRGRRPERAGRTGRVVMEGGGS